MDLLRLILVQLDPRDIVSFSQMSKINNYHAVLALDDAFFTNRLNIIYMKQIISSEESNKNHDGQYRQKYNEKYNAATRALICRVLDISHSYQIKNIINNASL